MAKRKIIFLSVTDFLVPRIRLENETLSQAGFPTEALFRKRVLWNAKTLLGLVGYYLKVIKKCREKRIWSVHMTNITQLLLAPILKSRRKVVVYDAYERYSLDISERHFSGPLKPLVRYGIEFIENLLVFSFVDAVFVVSTPREYLFKRYCSVCNRVCYLYNVPSTETLFQGSLSEKFQNDKLFLAYAGVISSDRGARQFIEIANKLRETGVSFEFHLIGRFSNLNEEKIVKEYVDDLGLRHVVKIHGHLDYGKMMELLYGCHIGLNLTRVTKRLHMIGVGASRKNFTYMSAGMALVSTDVGEMATVTKEENAGIVLKSPSDSDQVTSAIQSIWENRSLAIKMAENGLNAIRQRYNWENEKSKLIDIYNELHKIHRG